MFIACLAQNRQSVNVGHCRYDSGQSWGSRVVLLISALIGFSQSSLSPLRTVQPLSLSRDDGLASHLCLSWGSLQGSECPGSTAWAQVKAGASGSRDGVSPVVGKKGTQPQFTPPTPTPP